MKYTFEVNIEAVTQQEAEVKLLSASTLMQKLKVREIAKLADVVKNDPIKTNIAKKLWGCNRFSRCSQTLRRFKTLKQW